MKNFAPWCASVSGFVFAKIAQSKPSATIVLEKTPNHVNCWREILDVWPQAHFIHIIRDPRSVVASLRACLENLGIAMGFFQDLTRTARDGLRTSTMADKLGSATPELPGNHLSRIDRRMVRMS